MVIVIDPAGAGLPAHSGIVFLPIYGRQLGARGTLEGGVNGGDFGIAAVFQLLVIAPVIGHEADDALGKVVAGDDEHEQPVESQQHVLVAVAVAALAQYLLKVHGHGCNATELARPSRCRLVRVRSLPLPRTYCQPSPAALWVPQSAPKRHE